MANASTTERERFDAAFDAIVARGEKPTPGALNKEQGFHVRRPIPGRLSRHRIERLKTMGYVLNEQTKRWNLPFTVPEFSGGINLPDPPPPSTEALIADLYARTDALVERLANVAVRLAVLRDQIENTRWARFKRWFRANVYSGTAAPEIERSL